MLSQVEAFAITHGASRTAVLLTPFLTLLHRYAGDRDICVATRLDDSHGASPWSADVPVQLPMRGHHSVLEILRGVDAAMESTAIGDPGGSPLLAEAACSFGRGPAGRAVDEGSGAEPGHLLSVELLHLDPAPGVSSHGRGPSNLTLRWSCDPVAVAEAALRRMPHHYEQLLRAALAEPRCRVGDLPMLPADEAQRCLSWGTTEGTEPDRTVVDLLEETAARVPNAQAVICDDVQLTYTELLDRVGRLARQLRTAGLRTGMRVGVLMERSVGLHIALLAVLRAGGVYLPLDPHHPAPRISSILEDASVGFLLTDEHLGTPFSGPEIRLVHVDSRGAVDLPVGTMGKQDFRPTVDDVAYVVHTSGTTGNPKGVEVPHRALTNVLMHFGAEFGLGTGDTVAGVTTVSFDISILELLLPLVRGARLALLPRSVAADGAELREALTAYEVSFMQATPMTWRLLLDAGWQGEPRLTALSGGETTPPDLAAELCRKAGRVWNVYGPSETTIWSTSHRITETSTIVPIGRPIANTTLRVVDSGGQLVPIGLPGELYIGGTGLARGYLDRPDLTRERFVACPQGPAHVTMYRTGDLVRWSEQGELEFLGRIDRQVKVRGFRIELEEVEGRLNLHPLVRHGVVDVRRNSEGDTELVGYVVLEEAAPQALADIQASLARHLPEYMVPRPLVVLPELPLSINGKVLRDRLPDPRSVQQTGGPIRYAGSRERELAAIWADVLGVQRVSSAADFFELGGTSLHAQRIATRVNAAWKVKVRVSTVLRYPTVAELAAFLEGQGVAAL
ncbi:amino acid adenylation domain-containing protein [Streptomyces sp. NPDC006544]|uniref:non-ribosomal peptide synthetase n=1 Tax=Streptomyces sp. NPDC006544 TaxID=3154583 RepID=UPI0033AA5601